MCPLRDGIQRVWFEDDDAPESEDIQMLPLYTIAASFVPSADEAIDRQNCLPASSGIVASCQELPESVDI